MAETKIQTVAIQSLTTALPENIATDGTLEKLHNARYIAGGVENVSQFQTKTQITNFNGFTIVYLHKTNYIALDGNSKLHWVTKSLGSLISTQEIDNITDSKNLKISHFGNILYITENNSQRQYIFKSDRYCTVSIDNIIPLDNIDIEYEYMVTERFNSIYNTAIMACNIDSEEKEIDSKYNYPIAIAELHEQDFIYGAFYIIVAYRLFDGSVIKNSRAYMVKSEDDSNTGRAVVQCGKNMAFSDGNTYDYLYFRPFIGCKPTLKFKLSDETVNNELINSIVVYSTIPGDIYDFKNCHSILKKTIGEDYDNCTYLSSSYFFEDGIENYPDRPFYEVAELLIRDIEDGNGEITLTFNENFYQMEFKEVYKPSFSVHNVIHGSMIEYNSRLHTFNQSTELYSGVPLFYDYEVCHNLILEFNKITLDSPYKVEFCVEIKVDENSYEISSGKVDYCYMIGDSVSLADYFYIVVDNFISYPDYRAEKINIYYNNGSDRMLITSIPLTASIGNNFAYYIDTFNNSFTGCRGIASPKTDSFSPTHPLCQPLEPIITTNKIMVSDQNNPYSFNVLHTYSIESSEYEIYALSTAANQITENSYGNHPLIIFTSKGIYALEQGDGNVLYSRIVLIDNREQSSRIKAISLGETIYFTSDDELLSLNGRTITTLSKALERSKDRLTIDLEEFSRYVQNAELFALVWYSEVMVYNPAYDYAYIFMANNGGWYSRSIKGEYISANLIATDDGILATNLRENQNMPLPPHIITNALKLGSYDMKKIEYIAPIFTAPQNANIEITVRVSNDLNNWYGVSRSRFGTKIGRFGASWRYIKIDLEYKKAQNEANLHLFLSSIEFKFTQKYKNIFNA